ncbi:unnamed protein product [Orchesella dallaii]|uniref:RNA helicase n=1 Tax=Orchesella dallaii TaxID=48710 RepID=A0ABP1R3W8_9HEXA
MSASSGQKLTFEGEELNYNTDRDIQYCIRGSNKESSINSFTDPQLGLNARLLHNVNKAGLKKPTPIQRHGMAQLVAGLDVTCCSHTGSGKTAAYLLPIISSSVGEALASRSADKGSSSSSEKEKTSGTKPTALILTPTRELAMQISKDANMFGEGLPVYSFAVFGGQLLGYELETLKVSKSIRIQFVFEMCEKLHPPAFKTQDVVFENTADEYDNNRHHHNYHHEQKTLYR